MSARYAIIGDPVAHSLSPTMQNAAFRACEIDATYETMRVQREDLAAGIRDLRSVFAGCNVTTPLKEAVLPFLDTLTEEAQDARAVNTVRVDRDRLTGHNTDGSGFVAAIAELWNITPNGKTFCLLGSGPAARAIARAVERFGASRVTCWSRNPKTATLVGQPPNARPDVLVSALPATANVDPDVLRLVSDADFVFDLNYRAPQSPVPGGCGKHRSDGLPLLLHQGARSFEWWTGKVPPLDVMRAALG